MQIRTWTPPPGHLLHACVLSIFRARADGANSETILPKGNVDILFNLAAPMTTTGTAGRFEVRSTLVAGLNTRPLVSHRTHLHLIGVSLKAEAAFAVLRSPLGELTDRGVLGSLVLSDADRLRDQLGNEASFTRQCVLIERWLLRRVRIDRTVERVAAAARLIRRTGGINASAVQLGLSRRHLHRMFGERVGVSPADYLRLARFATALPRLHAAVSLADVAASSGYFDQAHFCRDFKTFGTMTPTEYREAVPVVPGHLFSAPMSH
jgi:AraC-like DNA-binding protein